MDEGKGGDQRGIGGASGDDDVGAGVERFGFVEIAILRGEHQDRGPVLALAKGATDDESVCTRQHDVEHDEVDGAGAELCAHGSTAISDADPIAMSRQVQSSREGKGKR